MNVNANAALGGVLLACMAVIFYQEHRLDEQVTRVTQSMELLEERNRVLELELAVMRSGLQAQHGSEIDAKKVAIATQAAQIAELKHKLKKSDAKVRDYEKKYNAQSKQIESMKVAYAEQFDLEKQQLESQASKQLEQKMSQLESEYSAAVNLKEQEERVDELMADFTELKVSLDTVNVCDKNYMDRYNQAKGMLSHIRTYVQKHEMSRDFYHFVISNDSQITRQAREVCIEI